VTLVTGPEELLADRAVNDAVAAARLQAQREGLDVDVVQRSASSLVAGELAAMISPSLFGDRPAVVLRDVQEAGESLAAELKAYLVAPDPDVTLVLVHKGGVRGKAVLDAARKGGAVVVECKEIRFDSDKQQFVRAEFARAGGRITADGARALVEAVGSDLRELAATCAQLVDDVEGPVDAEVVERYHAGRVEVTGFKVADAAIEGRCEDALRLLRHALATGLDPVPVNAALASGLRTLVRVGSSPRGARPDELARTLGLAPFMVRKARGQMGGWTGEGLATAIAAVATADADIKGAAVDPLYALERAVVTIARARQA
jgi:DNA polymerase-3 subunit delta